MAVKVVPLLKNPKINNPKNDYVASLRPIPGGTGHVVARQYKLTAVEARKLLVALEVKFPMVTDRQKAIENLFNRAKTDSGNRSKTRLGGLSLTKGAADELTAYAKFNTGLNLTFKSGQLPPIHPVG
jgi:hypothetical protein